MSATVKRYGFCECCNAECVLTYDVGEGGASGSFWSCVPCLPKLYAAKENADARDYIADAMVDAGEDDPRDEDESEPVDFYDRKEWADELSWRDE